jgi:hypothetical protein
MRMSPLSFAVLGTALLTLLLTSRARAQSAPSTDPTEPVDTQPLLTVPMPGSAPKPPPPNQLEAGNENVGESTAVPGDPFGDPPQKPNKVEAGDDNEGEEVAIPGDPWGDVASDGLISIRALFQGRYISTFAKKSRSERESYRVREDYQVQQNDGYSLNRVFMRIGADPSKYVGFKAVLDFSELIDGDPEDVLKQAYVTLRPLPQKLELVIGLFKLPFSVLELDASSRYEFADFGQTNRLNGDLGYAGRDTGVQLLWSPLRKAKRLRVSLGVFRGHMHDEHDSPAGVAAGRIETKPDKHWRIGASFVQHTKAVTYNRPFNTSDKDELPNPPDPLYPAQKRWAAGHAMSADLRYKKKGLMLRGEAQLGDRIDIDGRYGAKTFWAAWGMAAYRVDVTDTVRLLPAVRFEWLDADYQHKDRGVQQQLSVALNVLFWERARFVLDMTRIDVQSGTILINQPKPLLTDPFLALDHVRVTGQLQLEL